MSKLHLTLLSLTLVACGGSDSPPPAAPVQQGDAEERAHAPEEKAEHHEHDFPAEVTAFHDVLSPLWHAEAGDARRGQTCDALAKMTAAAGEIEAAAIPEKAAAEESKWREATAALTASLGQLDATCKAAGETFDADFKAVHDRFHDVIALIGHEERK